MPNRYPGTCYRCGGHVPPGAGVFEKTGRSQLAKWSTMAAAKGLIMTLPNFLVQHHDCARKHRGTSVHYVFNPDESQ